jgi:phosphoribosyl 1,2-cyclic phosphate phosphodiesterase
VLHHKLPVLGVRIGNMAYITDAKYIPEESMKSLENLDILIINALRKEPHISHFSLPEALDVIQKVKPERAFLTHISHRLGCHEDVEKELPEGVHLAYDGLEIETGQEQQNNY